MLSEALGSTSSIKHLDLEENIGGLDPTGMIVVDAGGHGLR